MDPFFSIIVPCYNQAHFLSDCLRSVLQQSFDDWEVIVINDGSTDHTDELTKSYASEDHRVRLVSQNNSGLSSARNAGMRHASGKFLLLLDADDMLDSMALEGVHQFLQVNPSVNIVRTGYAYVDERNTKIIYQVTSGSKQVPEQNIFYGNIGPPMVFYIKTDLANSLGGFDESLKSAEDWDFWLRAVKAGAVFGKLPRPYGFYRYVSNSMSRDAFRMYYALKTVAQRVPKKDERIQHESPKNIDRDIDVRPTIKRCLLTCLGVSVMQGKIIESVQLFKTECVENSFDFANHDFSPMYSYLSFRYWNNKEQVEHILRDIQPRFVQFFDQVGLRGRQKEDALDSIFSPVYKLRNSFRFGKIIGKLANRFL